MLKRLRKCAESGLFKNLRAEMLKVKKMLQKVLKVLQIDVLLSLFLRRCTIPQRLTLHFWDAQAVSEVSSSILPAVIFYCNYLKCWFAAFRCWKCWKCWKCTWRKMLKMLKVHLSKSFFFSRVFHRYLPLKMAKNKMLKVLKVHLSKKMCWKRCWNREKNVLKTLKVG